MLHALSLAGISFLVSASSTHGGPAGQACHDYVNRSFGPGQISFARAVVGGQDVVHIMRSDSRRTPFMEVRASDLLISYEYDMKGHLVDRKVWFNVPAVVRPKDYL